MLVRVWSESMFTLLNTYVILRIREVLIVFLVLQIHLFKTSHYHLCLSFADFPVDASDVLYRVFSVLCFVCAYVSRTAVTSMESSAVLE